MSIESAFRRAARAAALLPMLLAASCARMSREEAFAPASAEVEARLGEKVEWREASASESPEFAAALDALLAEPLTPDAAVRVAFLASRELQAEFEAIGLARADLIEAALPHNPSAAGLWKFPESGPSATSFEFEIAQDVFDLAAIPARRRVARAGLEAAQFEAADRALDLAARVRSAYFDLQAKMQEAAVRRSIEEAAAASAELAGRFEAAGNISELELSMRRDEAAEARIELQRGEAAVRAGREELTRLMGVWGARAAWNIPAELPAIPEAEPSLEGIEARAMERRLDLAAAKKENEAAARALAFARNRALFWDLELGVGGERELDGLWLLGPAVAFELPIFNRRQAEIARLEASLAISEHRLYALAVAARSEVRAARDRMTAARAEAELFRTAVIPARERIVQLSQEQYNFMLIGAFELLAARQREFESYTSYLGAVRDYWIARGDLERAAGGKLPGGESAEAGLKLQLAPPAGQEHQHEHEQEHDHDQQPEHSHDHEGNR